jgi:hypothetical protein
MVYHGFLQEISLVLKEILELKVTKVQLEYKVL